MCKVAALLVRDTQNMSGKPTPRKKHTRTNNKREASPSQKPKMYLRPIGRVKKHVMPVLSKMSSFVCNTNTPASSTSAAAPEKADDIYILEAYSEVQVQQRGVHAELTLLAADARTSADLAHWTLFVARKLLQRNETAHNALYLLFAYTASIRTDTARPDFARYKQKDTLCLQSENDMVVHTISTRFKNNMSRSENRMLIAATCLCVASKMEEGQYSAILRPGDIIFAMRASGNVLGQNTLYDFMTVERDLLETLRWRLFRVKGPIFFAETLFEHFAVADAEQQLTHDFMVKCLSSEEYVFAVPSDIAAICLVAALHQNDKMVPIAALAVFTGTTMAFLLKHRGYMTRMPARPPPCITRLADE